jgi:hypothetical protein
MHLYLYRVSRPICSVMAFYLYTVLYLQCYGSVFVKSVMSVVLWFCIGIANHTVPHVNCYGFVSVGMSISVVLWHYTCSLEALCVYHTFCGAMLGTCKMRLVSNIVAV